MILNFRNTIPIAARTCLIHKCIELLKIELDCNVSVKSPIRKQYWIGLWLHQRRAISIKSKTKIIEAFPGWVMFHIFKHFFLNLFFLTFFLLLILNFSETCKNKFGFEHSKRFSVTKIYLLSTQYFLFFLSFFLLIYCLWWYWVLWFLGLCLIADVLTSFLFFFLSKLNKNKSECACLDSVYIDQHLSIRYKYKTNLFMEWLVEINAIEMAADRLN